MNILGMFNFYRKFFGRKVTILFTYSVFVGLILFFTESAFVFVLQLFLFSIGLLSKDQLIIPFWFKTDLITTNVSFVVLFIFGFIRSISFMLKYYLAGSVGQEFIKTQREKITFVAISNSDLFKSSEVINVYNERVLQGGTFLQHLSQLIIVLTSSTLFFISGFNIAPMEMIIGLFGLSVVLFPMKKLTQKIKKLGIELRDESNLTSNLLLNSLRNHFFLKIYRLTRLEVDRCHRSLERYRNVYSLYFKISAIKNQLPGLVGIWVLCLISYSSVNYLKTNPVNLISFFYIFIRMSQGFSEASACFSDLSLYRPGLEELIRWDELYDNAVKSSSEVNRNNNYYEINDDINIRINNLNFYYSESRYIIKNVNIEMNKNELILIKGPSGAGKSTFLRLLLGILKPKSGNVLINNFESSDRKIDWSKLLGYAGPEPFLIHETLRQNLLYGLPLDVNYGDKELIDALEFSGLSELSGQMDCLINEHASLSTGQKQRIAIARAVLRKPKLLILDEATANLDRKTENHIINNLLNRKKELILVVVSHKSSFDEYADKIIEFG